MHTHLQESHEHKPINSEFPLSAFSSGQEFVKIQTSAALLIGHNECIPDDSHPFSECTALPECRRLDFHFKSILQYCVYGQSYSSLCSVEDPNRFTMFLPPAVPLTQLLTAV